MDMEEMRAGLTTLELLLVMAILAVLVAIGLPQGRAILRGQEARSSLNTLRQVFWQGATLASSRGTRLELVRLGSSLLLRPEGGTQVFRRWDLNEVATDLPQGQLAFFTPPGKVEFSPSFPNPFTVQARGKRYQYLVSLIGEVRVTEVSP